MNRWVDSWLCTRGSVSWAANDKRSTKKKNLKKKGEKGIKGEGWKTEIKRGREERERWEGDKGPVQPGGSDQDAIF